MVDDAPDIRRLPAPVPASVSHFDAASRGRRPCADHHGGRTAWVLGDAARRVEARHGRAHDAAMKLRTAVCHARLTGAVVVVPSFAREQQRAPDVKEGSSVASPPPGRSRACRQLKPPGQPRSKRYRRDAYGVSCRLGPPTAREASAPRRRFQPVRPFGWSPSLRPGTDRMEGGAVPGETARYWPGIGACLGRRREPLSSSCTASAAPASGPAR